MITQTPDTILTNLKLWAGVVHLDQLVAIDWRGWLAILGFILILVATLGPLVRMIRGEGSGRNPSSTVEAGRSENTVPAPDTRLVQLSEAWMMPAWDKAIALLIAVRGAQQSRHPLQAELMQLGLFDPAVASWRAVQARIKGERTDDLDALMARMYEQYEMIVKWISFAGEAVGLPVPGSQPLLDWREDDAKCLDHIRDLVALPDFKISQLEQSYRTIQEGGVAKSVRQRLGASVSSEAGYLPLIVEVDNHDDSSGQWRCLKVTNPNTVTARAVTVTTEAFLIDGSRVAGWGPPPGFAFPWRTWQHDDATVTTDIPNGPPHYADLFIGPPDRTHGFDYANRGPVGSRSVQRINCMGQGRFVLQAIVAASDPPIPPAPIRLLVTFDTLDRLHVRFMQKDEVNPPSDLGITTEER